MPEFLSDPDTTIYVVFLLMVLLTGAIWWNQRGRRSLIVFAVALAGIAIVALVDVLVESSREQAVRKMQEIVAAVNARNLDAMTAHISPEFSYQSRPLGKQGLRAAAERAIQVTDLKDLKVWDFPRETVRRDGNRLTFECKVKGTTAYMDRPFFFCLATFTQDSDGQVRLSAVELLDPIRGEKVTIPYF